MPKVRLADGNLVEVNFIDLLNDDDSPLQIPTGPVFTAEDIERARSEEKDKLYGRIESLASTITDLNNKVGTLTQAEEQRLQAAEAERARLEAEAAARSEEGLDPVELIRRRDEEWNNRLAQTEQTWEQRLAEERQAREQRDAVDQRERELQSLQQYTEQQIAANKDTIAPELLSWVGGATQAEVDASVARAIETTNQIVTNMQADLGQVQQQHQQVPDVVQQAVQQHAVPPLPGVRPTGGPGNTDPASQFQQLSAQDIKDMPMDKYMELRQRMGIGGRQADRGMFG